MGHCRIAIYRGQCRGQKWLEHQSLEVYSLHFRAIFSTLSLPSHIIFPSYQQKEKGGSLGYLYVSSAIPVIR